MNTRGIIPMQEETSLKKGDETPGVSYFYFIFNLSFLIRKPKLSLLLYPIRSERAKFIYHEKKFCSR